MILEKSCGAVVYKIVNNQVFFLIEKMKSGHYSMPKGHVEDGETEIQTALREIKEETNLDVTIDHLFRETITYSPYENCLKDVIFFLAKTDGKNVINQECEVSNIYFYNFNKAYKTLTFDSDKKVLLKAYLYLLSKNYKKIILIGCPGSGKSYLSKKISAKLDIPVYHLDNLFWYGNWQHITTEQLKEKVDKIIENEKWIIDGNYSKTLKDRIDKADFIFFMNLSSKTCLKGYFNRINKKRDDIPKTCIEEIDDEFIEYIKKFRKLKSPSIIKMIENKNSIIINNLKTRRIVVKYFS